MRILTLSAALALAFALPAAAQDDVHTLLVGDPAPSLADVNWIKGDAVKSWQPGTTYVLDFWATWCGPCRASIPHLNELAKSRRDKGVQVIGVAIWPNDAMVPTRDFVEEKGDAMDYKICEDVDRKTATAFMEASGQNGIPTCMIVDGTGTIAWIGHPMAGLDENLEQVLAGTWDIQKAREEHKAEMEARKEEMRVRQMAMPLATALKEAKDAGDWAAVADNAAKLGALHENFKGAFIDQYDALVHLGKKEEASTLGNDLATSRYNQDSSLLNGLAWIIVDPERNLELEQRDLDLALKAAQRADELTEHKNPSVLDTVARVYFWKGDLAQAIELQAQAVELAPDAEGLQKTLDEYRQMQG
jgi:thiol-disulfide isomerase/thioredoxin